ncbi:MAG: hypothetical protein CMJ85_12500 [Planctomycetes bacterium]|nr:hypothetical protein [Planctomycetota bacterium]
MVKARPGGARRRHARQLLLRSAWPFLMVLMSALFLAQVLSAVVGPLRMAHSVALDLQQARGVYIAEDAFHCALQAGLMTTKSVEVAEGELSPFPERRARVVARRQAGATQLYCSLRRRGQDIVFTGRHVRGVLPPALSWAVGQVETREVDDDVIVRGRSDRLALDPRHGDAFPLAIPGSWEVQADLHVRASDLAAPDGSERGMNLANFRLANELALATLAEPTELDDFELGAGANRVASFRARRDIVVRVFGHLWLGGPKGIARIGTGGHCLVLLVTGNVYIRGGLDLLGPRDRVVIVAGRPGWGGFRDANVNGRRDAGEVILGHAKGDALGPREGAGNIYLGLGLSGKAAYVRASLVARHDVLIGPSGASVIGSVLAGGRLVRSGVAPGTLELTAEPRFLDAALPHRGLPLLPGTEQQDRVMDIQRVWARASED